MSEQKPVITAVGLTKKFKLYASAKARLREVFNPFKNYHKDHYALSDVSFSLKPGEALGIVGRNGAGKSTLLKLISGVLHPTSGALEVNGKIAALLELGGGFNPDLSGLENIYFQGAIQGFHRHEMESKVKDIVDFAELGDFIHQPVKKYSSGMFARLAFSIAINIEPDILIVDEALSVGDFLFKQKCYQKIRDLLEKNTAILFVSHDPGAIQQFCNKALYLKNGKIQSFGDTHEVIRRYMAEAHIPDANKAESADGQLKSFGEGKAKILDFSFMQEGEKNIFTPGKKVNVVLKIQCLKDIDVMGVGFVLRDRYYNDLIIINNYMYDYGLVDLKAGQVLKVEMSFNFPNLVNGRYSLSPAVSEGILSEHKQQDWIYDAQVIIVQSAAPQGKGLMMLPEVQFNKEFS